MHEEKIKRSLAKAISYRLFIIGADTIVVYFFTRHIAITAGIVAVSNLSSTIVYFFHERLWNYIRWGRSSAVR